MRFRLMMLLSGSAILSVFLTQSAGTQEQITQQTRLPRRSSLNVVPGEQRPGTDWPMYRHDQAGSGYSPLAQIDTKNVATLRQRWTYPLQTTNSQATPIVVNGVMYVPAANRVVALDPETGTEIWQHPVTGGAPSRRGVAYWPGDGNHPARIIFTTGRRLIALNANSGVPDPSFGEQGVVDLVVPFNSVPLIYRSIVVVGGNSPPPPASVPGNARAFDARTGAKLWEFSSVAQPGTVTTVRLKPDTTAGSVRLQADRGPLSNDTWEGDSWKGRSGVNAWPFYFTLDEQRGLVYIPLGAPSPGPYGGDRKGANLFANSVVAVDVQTGAYKWHFQTIHHDLWDADPPAPPGLLNIVRNGRTIPVAALTTKSGYLYLLNRETGQPIFGVEERAVPKSDVPGERTFPTQPFPVRPQPLARVSYKPEDLVTAADTSPEHVNACQELIAKVGGVYNAGPFTPWLHRAEGAPLKAALVFPGGLGGANWGGTAFDPKSGYVFVVTQDVGSLGWMEKAKEGSPVPFVKNFPERTGTFDVPMPGGLNWPCQKPPWGRLIAVNASTGNIAWQIRLGITEQLPADKQNTGRPALAGPIVTAGGLLFVASTDDNRFRALDARSGKELWMTRLERRGNADPITYQGKSGKQYVAVVATDTVAAYALP